MLSEGTQTVCGDYEFQFLGRLRLVEIFRKASMANRILTSKKFNGTVINTVYLIYLPQPDYYLFENAGSRPKCCKHYT